MALQSRWGIPFMVIGSVLMTMQGYIVKEMIPHRDTVTLLLARFFVGFVLIVISLLFLHRSSTLVHKYVPNKGWKLSLLSGVVGFIAIGSYFWSLQTLPLSTATLLFFSFPLFLPWLYKIVGKQAVPCRVLGGTLLLALGTVTVMMPVGFSEAAIAICSGIMLTLWMIMMKVLYSKETSSKIALYYFGSASLCAGVVCLLYHGYAPMALSSVEKYALLALGVIGVLSQLCFTLSLRYAPARLVAPFLYLSVVLMALIDIGWFKISIDRASIIGIVLAIVGGVWVMRMTFKGACGNL